MGIRTDIDKLEAQNRYNDAVIEATKVQDLASLDIANMTVGEIITLANAIEAIRVLTSDRDAADKPASVLAPVNSGVSPLTFAEKREYGYEPRRNPYADKPDKAADDALRARVAQMLSDAIPADYEVPTVNGPIRYGDIPKGPDGLPVAGWIDANCACAEHEAARKSTAPADEAATGPTGMYV
jgi:hypothetical protein